MVIGARTTPGSHLAAEVRGPWEAASGPEGYAAVEDATHDAVTALEPVGDLADAPALLIQSYGVVGHVLIFVRLTVLFAAEYFADVDGAVAPMAARRE
jgi:hypothetical protein